MNRLDRPALAAAILAAAMAVTTAVLLPDQVQPLLVPLLFVLAGALGPLWQAARFTCRALIAIGGLHLLAFAAAAASGLLPGSAWWHALSLTSYALGFGVLVPLAAGYPAGPAPRWTLMLVACDTALPVAAVLAGPTPSVLVGSDLPLMWPPVAALLPGVIAQVAGAVFVLPVVAVVVGVVRAVRGGREVRGRLVLPLAALLFLAVVVVGGAVGRQGPLATALFLMAAPLLPVALVAGSRPVPEPPEPVQVAPTVDPEILARLTPREREVLALMAEGRSNPAIGRSLHISLSSVEKHAGSVFAKLGLVPEADTHRRVAAVVAYLRAARS